ncbi:Chaperone protein Skp, partial [termite gut metagenome]
MKKPVLFVILLFAVSLMANAQKFALIDMEYILQHIPDYEQANEQLNQLSQKYQNEVEALTQQTQSLYKDYQSKAASLSEEQRMKKEE